MENWDGIFQRLEAKSTFVWAFFIICFAFAAGAFVFFLLSLIDPFAESGWLYDRWHCAGMLLATIAFGVSATLFDYLSYKGDKCDRASKQRNVLSECLKERAEIYSRPAFSFLVETLRSVLELLEINEFSEDLSADLNKSFLAAYQTAVAISSAAPGEFRIRQEQMLQDPLVFRGGLVRLLDAENVNEPFARNASRRPRLGFPIYF